MSPVIVTALLLTVTLLIISVFMLSAWGARHKHMRVLAEQRKDELSTTTGRMMVVMQLMDGSVVGIENQAPVELTHTLPAVVPSAHLSSSWYNRQRSLVSLGLLAMLVLGLLIQTGVAGDMVHKLTQGITLNSAQLSAQNISTAFQPLPDTASSRIVRVNSAASNQYSTNAQLQIWSWSSCSGISLEEVINAYGHHYIASDMLQVELNMGIWNTYDGLTAGEPGMARAAAHFGFKADPNPPRTLQALIDVTNSGTPVIIGMPGHILVMKGGDANNVFLVDSSLANRTILTHAQFMNIWTKFSVLLTPIGM
ncbi:MAG: hypothetical protein ABI234_10415 [Ktedonobacteraceae bacterium]